MAKDKNTPTTGLGEQERFNLETLRERISAGGGTVSAETVGRVLPEAVKAAPPGLLSRALMGPTEKAIDLSIHKDTEVLATSLFPIIGPAIRKALAAFVAESMARLDAGLEKTLSPRRLAWRIESWRTGVSFVDIIMRHTILYSVEQVFLVHRKAGLLLAGLSRESKAVADEDMVSSMLTAVQDYIKDSLSLDRGEAVRSLSAGEYSLIIEEGPLAMLVLIIRGEADPSLRTRAQGVLEAIHLDFGAELKSFSGNTDAFSACIPTLKPCLVARKKGGDKPVRGMVAMALLATVLALLAGRSLILGARDRAYIRALEAEPGYVVVSEERRGGRLVLHLLKDPLARRLEDLGPLPSLLGTDLAFSTEPYLSLEPGFVETRLRRVLGPSPGLDLSLQDGVLHIRGQADRTWTETSLALALAVPGVESVSWGTGEAASPAAELPALAPLEAELKGLTLRFRSDSDELLPGQAARVARIGELLAAIIEAGKAADRPLDIELVGHSAGKAHDETALRLSQDRAEMIRGLVLAARPALTGRLLTRGAGSREPVSAGSDPEAEAGNRSVTFRAVFR